MSLTSPSHLRHALKRIAAASSHPNALAYKFQLRGAEQKYLVRETGNGEIALPPPSSAAMLEGETTIKDPIVTKTEPGCEGKTIIESKTVERKHWEESGGRLSMEVSSRRFMALAIFDTPASIVAFFWDGTKSAEHLRGV